MMKLYNKLKSMSYWLWAYKISCVISILLVIFVYYALKQVHYYVKVPLLEDDYLMLEGYEPRGPAVSGEVLAARVERLNAEQRLRNAERFPGGGGAVLLLRAGRGAAALQRLLRALADVDGIEGVLLVVSHNFYDDKINALVRSVRFCRVLQVFFPHSRQLAADGVPGAEGPRCRKGAPAASCVPRAGRGETKQHWWWNAHFLFNHYLTGKGDRLVLFLQEEDYVLPDLLHVLQYAQRALAYHPEAEVISLGGPPGARPDYSALRVEAWRPAHARGLAFNHSTWRRVEARAALYCAYDDANWSYSLLNVFAALPGGRAGVVASAAPRVLAEPARPPLSTLFPACVRSVFAVSPGGRAAPRLRAPPRGAGGWSDPRDQLLCLDPFLSTTTYSVPATTTPPAEEYNTTFTFLV